MRLLSIFLLSTTLWAAHPQLLFDAEDLAFMRAKVAANHADWVALKTECDGYLNAKVYYPSQNAQSGSGIQVAGGTGTSSTLPYVVGNADYYGLQFEKTSRILGVCYLSLIDTDPTAARVYSTKLKEFVTAIAEPNSTVTINGYPFPVFSRQLAGATANFEFYQNSTRMIGYPPDTYLIVNDPITIAGMTGCTDWNGDWLINTVVGTGFTIKNIDGSPAPVANANCTNKNYNILGNSAFGFRGFTPALAMIYDWIYDELDASQRAALLGTMNFQVREVTRYGYGLTHPENNYADSHLAGVAMVLAAATGDDPALVAFAQTTLDNRFSGPTGRKGYSLKWLSGGGYGEGLQAYGYGSMERVATAQKVMRVLGVNWASEGFNYQEWQAKYFMGMVSASKTTLDENESVYPSAVDEPTRLNFGIAAMVLHELKKQSSSYLPMFKYYLDDVLAHVAATARTGPTSAIPVVEKFAYYDESIPSSDYKTLPLYYRAWDGNFITVRGSWADDAVVLRLVGSPTIGNSGNGKTQFNSGAFTMMRGADHLIIFGMGESSRRTKPGDVITATIQNTLHNERATYGNKKNSIFWAGRPLDTRNQGLLSLIHPPGNNVSLTSWPASIDRFEDQTPYAYARMSHLEASNSTSAIDGLRHQIAWTRQVLFLRPKVAVVYDQTTTRFADDDRSMFWTFGRTLTEVSAPAGMHKFQAEYGGVFRGAMTQVLPASASAPIIDHANVHAIYRVEVRPALDHTSDNWLHVFDAATSSGAVDTVASISGVGVDAVLIGTATVAGFATTDPPATSISYDAGTTGVTSHTLAGFAPSTTYTINGGAVTASPQGVLRFSTTTGAVTIGDPIATLAVAPTAVAFTAAYQQVTVPTQSVAVSRTISDGAYTATESCAWLAVSPGSGTTPATLTLTASTSGVAVGSYSCDVTITSTGAVGSPLTLPVAFTVTALPVGDGLTVEATRRGTAAIVTLRGAASYQTECSVKAKGPDGVTVSEASSLQGPSVRRVAISALDPATAYTFSAICGDIGGAVESAATPAVSGNVPVYISLPCSADVAVYYGLDLASTATATHSAGRCTATLGTPGSDPFGLPAGIATAIKLCRTAGNCTSTIYRIP